MEIIISDVKYSGRIDERIRKWIKYLEDDSLDNLKEKKKSNKQT